MPAYFGASECKPLKPFFTYKMRYWCLPTSAERCGIVPAQQLVPALRCEASCWPKDTATTACSWSSQCRVKIETDRLWRLLGELEVWQRGRAGEAEAVGETRESSFASYQYQISRLGFTAGREQRGKEQGVAGVWEEGESTLSLQYWGLDSKLNSFAISVLVFWSAFGLFRFVFCQGRRSWAVLPLSHKQVC